MEPGDPSFDPDFNLRGDRAIREPLEPIEDCQRLVANPFLAVFFWTGTVAFLRESAHDHNLNYFVWAMLLLVLGGVFLQFHCLDCGKTRWLLGWRRHACPTVVARRERLLPPPRLRGPDLKMQLVVWSIFIAAAFVFVMLMLMSNQ